MKIWLIKHKGKTWWGNFLLDHKISQGDKEIGYAQFFYFRKKDAELVRAMMSHDEFYEVVSAELQQSKQDNRKQK